MAIPTKERLAQRLHSLGLFDLERRAREGEWSDFESDHVCPKVELVGELSKISKRTTNLVLAQQAYNLGREVMEGKWDDTKEEADEWFRREGKDLLKGN